LSRTTPTQGELTDHPDEAITAKVMAKALNTVATKLNEWGLVTPSGYSALVGEATRLGRFREETTWSLEIDRSNPIAFIESEDKNGNAIFPRIVCEGISVNYHHKSLPPFQAFDIAMEIVDETQSPVARWHIDLANEKDDGMQSGPLTHIQFGGHVQGHRDKDHPLKVPRWCHPPMDLILLCEVTAANFYTEFWEKLREDQNWCQAVSVGQRLCYSAYLRKMTSCLSVSSRTLLHSMWASEWQLDPGAIPVRSP